MKENPRLPASSFDRLAPLTFVLLWSTGWISARYAAFDADALTFLSLRFALAGLVLLIYAKAAGAAWPGSRAQWGHAMVSGVLLHAVYLGGVWWALRHGVSTTLSGVIAALQPILTALLAPLLIGERISPLRWLGVFCGFAGIVVVLSPKFAQLDAGQISATLMPLIINVIGMIGVTLGTFYQKRFIQTGDLRTVTFLQYIGAIAVTLPLAFLFEDRVMNWTPTLIATMAWSVLALSIGAIALLLLIIRRGAVSRYAALIYLVPPAVALEAWLLFGESLSPLQIGGMALTVLGVALATRR